MQRLSNSIIAEQFQSITLKQTYQWSLKAKIVGSEKACGDPRA
jgi:hypothetical protein